MLRSATTAFSSLSTTMMLSVSSMEEGAVRIRQLTVCVRNEGDQKEAWVSEGGLLHCLKKYGDNRLLRCRVMSY